MGLVWPRRLGMLPAGDDSGGSGGGEAVALANVDGNSTPSTVFAFIGEGPLGTDRWRGGGDVPWHGWQYDVRTGKVPQNPTWVWECYAVEVRGDEIFVNVGS